ncbi:sugar ABC transporter substrate-binding protein [Variovorax sp. J31P207]|uniref:sugar ABC transporter substrate-binding protein n=1 Tax=Variovorax sp. J31P207 TaxID=3053510 RepID=UPI0025756642|nr:sugar ABC transporter substrate-binding protein [Variovorax sp. J31P207]MDM0071506.1 sugar ABC transporter substrate-binding protein [Variovorax sp. J31P207]
MKFNSPLRLLSALLCASGLIASAHAGASGSKVILLGADDVCEYCAVYNDAARKFAKEAGIELEVVTNKFDPAQQASQVDQAIAKKPAAILLWAIDGSALIPSMRKIKAAKIPLLLTDVEPDKKFQDLWVHYSGGDYAGEGRSAAKLMVEAFKAKGLGTSGDIVMITGILGQSQSIDRARGFKEELAKIAPGIKVVGEQPGNWDQGVSTTAAAGLLTKFAGKVKGVYAHEDAMMAGAVVAAERANLNPSTMAMVGVGCEPIGVSLIKSGKMYGTVKQSPIDEARYAIDSAVALLDGKTLEKTRYTPMPAVTSANVEKECQPWPAR